MFKSAFFLFSGIAIGAGGTIYLLRKRLSLSSLFGASDTLAALPQQAIATHLRQIRRYAFAASQDMSPIVGLTHASYALVLLDTLEEVVGKEIAAQAGIDTSKLRAFIAAQQDRHAETLERCDTHLQNVLAIERNAGTQRFTLAAAPRGA